MFIHEFITKCLILWVARVESSRCTRIPWSTVSKAAYRSNVTKADKSLASTAKSMSIKTQHSGLRYQSNNGTLGVDVVTCRMGHHRGSRVHRLNATADVMKTFQRLPSVSKRILVSFEATEDHGDSLRRQGLPLQRELTQWRNSQSRRSRTNP